MNPTVEWTNGRQNRKEEFLGNIEGALLANLVGLEFLSGVMNEFPNRIRIGRENIIILGELANYCIPIQKLINTFTNPFEYRSGYGLPQVEVHPRHKWIKNEPRACIQPASQSGIPATDSLAILINSLIADRGLFSHSSQTSFRKALLSIYGYTISPITDIFSSFLSEEFNATLNPEKEEITIPGTHGWTWHVSGLTDPELRDFKLSSSIRGGAHRLHSLDTAYSVPYASIESLMIVLSKAPGFLLTEEGREFLNRESMIEGGIELKESIAKVWAPYRRIFNREMAEIED
jgi:hypothetical protein